MSWQVLITTFAPRRRLQSAWLGCILYSGNQATQQSILSSYDPITESLQTWQVSPRQLDLQSYISTSSTYMYSHLLLDGYTKTSIDIVGICTSTLPCTRQWVSYILPTTKVGTCSTYIYLGTCKQARLLLMSTCRQVQVDRYVGVYIKQQYPKC